MALSRPIQDFTRYLQIIRNRSMRTIEEYELDLILFFRYLLALKNQIPFKSENFDKQDISAVDYDYLRNSVGTNEIYGFLSYVSTERHNKARSLAHKLSALKSFYRYQTVTAKNLPENPAKDIEMPSVRPGLPKFLSLEESLHLLDTIDADEESPTRTRDYTIVTLFLNCGMRLNELVGLNLTDLDPALRSMRVVGKGSKERVIYLNDACKSVLQAYLPTRADNGTPIEPNALFLSSRRTRISPKTVQWMVGKYLRMAGFGNRHLSTHKLRHTAATLMYQSGEVDVRVLKDILGHEQLNTTQIYTHVSDEGMERAMQKNPLAAKRRGKSARKATSQEEPVESEENPSPIRRIGGTKSHA